MDEDGLDIGDMTEKEYNKITKEYNKNNSDKLELTVGVLNTQTNTIIKRLGLH